jgi:hypothetical protein
MKRTVIFMLIVGLFAISIIVGYVLGSSVLVDFFTGIRHRIRICVGHVLGG